MIHCQLSKIPSSSPCHVNCALAPHHAIMLVLHPHSPEQQVVSSQYVWGRVLHKDTFLFLLKLWRANNQNWWLLSSDHPLHHQGGWYYFQTLLVIYSQWVTKKGSPLWGKLWLVSDKWDATFRFCQETNVIRVMHTLTPPLDSSRTFILQMLQKDYYHTKWSLTVCFPLIWCMTVTAM